MQKIITFFIILLFTISNVRAFDLFNPERGKPPPKPIEPVIPTIDSSSKKLETPFTAKTSVKPIPKKKPRKLLPQKDFALKGTSIIGEKRAAILLAPNKKEFIQYLKDNRRTEIDSTKYLNSEKYRGYYLLKVNAREVQIEYPLDAPCQKDKEKNGVVCNKKGNGVTVASLSLKQRKALKAPKPPVTLKPAISKAEIDKKRDEDLEKRKKIYKNFKRKVIKDEDVPPGMRVVRTPFGDRLVPIK
ncbi:hypothetical protein QUF50_01155 [Thiotrichales bacterium HSG1]|nr:hypothetical protein [Thiotrichales bacterium HSG1]